VPSPKQDPRSELSGARRSVWRALDVLEFLVRGSPECSLRELSRYLSVPLSSMHDLVSPMLERGYLEHTSHSNLRIGPAFRHLAHAVADNVDFVSQADSVLEQVARISGRTASLCVLEGRFGVIVRQVEAQTDVRVVQKLGVPYPAYASASGKAILSLLPREEVERLFPEEEFAPVTPHTLPNKTALFLELERIRETGVAFNRQETHVGFIVVASPVLNGRGVPVATVTANYLAAESNDLLDSQMAALLKAGASIVSRDLGYVAPGSGYASSPEDLVRAWEQARFP
jgi:DNA-binding IclR family transcriptional regulator